jgi:hypothetical protein
MKKWAGWEFAAEHLLPRLDVTLSEEQAAAFWEDAYVMICAGGEGSGKSFLGGLMAVVRLSCQARLDSFNTMYQGWVVGADFEDARKELDYIFEFASTLGLIDLSKSSMPTSRDQKCILHLKGLAVIETISAYDPKKIGRDQPDFIIGCEVSRWEKETYDRIYGRLARKAPKSWGFLSGSFDTSVGWFPEMWEVGQGNNLLDVKSVSMPSWANLTIYPGGRNDPAILRLEEASSPGYFLERYGGRPTPPRDAVLPEFKQVLHVANVEHDKDHPVHLFVDPGDKVYCILFVQLINGEVRVLDEVYLAHHSHEQVIQACSLKSLWKFVHPSTKHVMDVAGKQRHFGFGTPEDAWYRDTGIRFVMNYMKIDATLERLRQVLAIDPMSGRPRLRINPRCPGLISEGGGARSPVEDGGIWRMRNGKPRAENDHAWKALGYGLGALYGTMRPVDRSYSAIDEEEFGQDSTTYLKRPGTPKVSSFNAESFFRMKGR